MFVTLWKRRADPPPPANGDLPRRRPVWAALSELYLDTELDERDHARLGHVLVDSGYSVDQLEEILYRELHPTLMWNLLTAAGEWSGFDVLWLEARILRRGPPRWPIALLFGKEFVANEWAALRQNVEARSAERPTA